jgi:hypothetical protein
MKRPKKKLTKCCHCGRRRVCTWELSIDGEWVWFCKETPEG